MDGVVTEGELSSLTHVTSIDASSSSDDFMTHQPGTSDRHRVDGVMIAGDEMLIGVRCGDDVSSASGCLMSEVEVTSHCAADYNQSHLDEHRTVDKYVSEVDAHIELNVVHSNDDDKNAWIPSASSVTPCSSVAIDEASTDVPVHPVAITTVLAATSSDSHAYSLISVTASNSFFSDRVYPGSERVAVVEAADMSAMSCAVSGLNAPPPSTESDNLLHQKHGSAAEASDKGHSMNSAIQQPEFCEATFGSDSNHEFFPSREVKTHTAGPHLPERAVSVTDTCSVNNSNIAATVSECCLTETSGVRRREKSDTARLNVADDFAALQQVSWIFYVKIILTVLYVCILRAGVQPTQDPYAEAFL